MRLAGLPSFVAASIEVQHHPFVPQVQLGLAGDLVGLWEAAEEAMGRGDLPPPFWASAWPGGLALARYLLEHPHLVAGRTVVDVATGSGVVAIAAALAGAGTVIACDTDELAVEATKANASCNGVDVSVSTSDVREIGAPDGALVTAGDVFYDRDISQAMLEDLTRLANGGAEVLIGDPFRAFLPDARLEPIAQFDVTTDAGVEGVPVKATLVARLTCG